MDDLDYYSMDDSHDMAHDIRDYFPPGTTDEEIDALYSNPEQFNRYLELYYKEMQQDYSVFNQCVVPVTTQAFQQMWQILLFCLILRCLSKFGVNRSFVHFLSIVFGFLSMWKFYGKEMVYVVLPLFLFVPFFRIQGIFRGHITCIAATIYLLACEFFLLDAVHWNKVKGSVMIALMKAISVVFDSEKGLKEIPDNLLEFYSYVFSPASIIFGPFITYKNYMQLFQSHPVSLSWMLHCLRSILLCALCLVWSSCVAGVLSPQLTAHIPVLEDNKWWAAYHEAQAFRSSHYFVCYFSESSCLLSGIGTMETVEYVEKDKNEEVSAGSDSRITETKQNGETILEKENNNVVWRLPVANIMYVELPGSLVDLVTNWNLPMHFWLKSYIYKPTRKYGAFIAILVTYIASSVLHGMNFQLSAVLLSVGIFAYIESVSRHTLATLLNACIEARPCRNTCSHLYKHNIFWVTSVNLLFSFLAMWNLAYLGCLFDSSPEEEQGYSATHALQKWAKYDFLNHYFMVGLFFTHLIIKMSKSYMT